MCALTSTVQHTLELEKWGIMNMLIYSLQGSPRRVSCEGQNHGTIFVSLLDPLILED